MPAPPLLLLPPPLFPPPPPLPPHLRKLHATLSATSIWHIFFLNSRHSSVQSIALSTVNPQPEPGQGRAQQQQQLGPYLAIRMSSAKPAPRTDSPSFSSGLTVTQGVQAPVKRQESPHLIYGNRKKKKKKEEKANGARTKPEAGSLRPRFAWWSACVLFFFFLLFLSMFSRLWFDWARLDDDIWGVGGSPSRSSAGRSRRSRICTAAAATPAAILDTEVEPHETLVRTSSSADRSGTHTSKKSAYITVSFTVLCPVCVCVCVCVTTAVLIYIRVMVGGLFAAWRTTWIPTYLLHFTFRTQNQFGSAALCDTQRAALVFWMRREDRKLTPSPTGRTVSRSPF